MNLRALLFAPAREHGLTQLPHLRWLDRCGDAAGTRLARSGGAFLVAAAVLVVLVPALPIAAVSAAPGPKLPGLPQLAFAVFVPRFSFGPRDPRHELDDDLAALERGDRDAADSYGAALTKVHGVLAWVPARLATLSYALAGSFEDASGNWRAAVTGENAGPLDRTEDLLARVGRGSRRPELASVPPGELDVATARGAMRIVLRALWIGLVVVALLVLVGGDT
jgi:membrane protein required for beta-lactamase induction